MNTKVTARARITYRILCITLQITFAYQKHCHGMGQRTQEVSSTLSITGLQIQISKFVRIVLEFRCLTLVISFCYLDLQIYSY